jgi:hypothetical protein
MDINKSGNTIHIKADKDKNIQNTINVERKGNNTEVTIDGATEVFTGNKKIIIDAGDGNDNIKVSNIASGKSKAPQISIIGGTGDDNIQAVGNVEIIDNKGNNYIVNGSKGPQQAGLEAKINGYIAEINAIFDKPDEAFHHLELSEKEEILEILKRSKNDGTLIGLANNLDDENKLSELYRKMGTMINQGVTGVTISSIMGIMPGINSLEIEKKQNRTHEMKQIFIEANVPQDILNKLQ